MKKIIIRSVLFMTVVAGIHLDNSVYAQVYKTTKGSGAFSVAAPAKTINADSRQVSIEIDKGKASLRLSVPVASFEFSNNFVSDSMNTVIHERFNSYYMESDKYPDVTYEATIDNNSNINYEKDGSYPIRTRGKLRIHGVEQEMLAEGMVQVSGGEVSVAAKIKVLPADYKIRIPSYIGNMYFREVLIESKATLKRK